MFSKQQRGSGFRKSQYFLKKISEKWFSAWKMWQLFAIFDYFQEKVKLNLFSFDPTGSFQEIE
jgi:hypothetical protein